MWLRVSNASKHCSTLDQLQGSWTLILFLRLKSLYFILFLILISLYKHENVQHSEKITRCVYPLTNTLLHNCDHVYLTVLSTVLSWISSKVAEPLFYCWDWNLFILFSFSLNFPVQKWKRSTHWKKSRDVFIHWRTLFPVISCCLDDLYFSALYHMGLSFFTACLVNGE